jgi:UDP-3-O-[3-hydroxymyristoyl] glucosamine N-acyltransferase
MIDPAFHPKTGPFSLNYLSTFVGGELSDSAEGDTMISGIDGLDSAGRGDLSIFCDDRYLAAFARSTASAVVTSKAWARHAPKGMSLLLVQEPRLSYAKIGRLIYPGAIITGGVHAKAQVDEGATLGSDCRVDSGAVIGARVKLGSRCHVGCNAVLGDGVVVGDDCSIGANTTISHAVIGSRVRIAPGVSIGGEGFGFVATKTGMVRAPHLGRVMLGDDVEIGANCAIDRGAADDTVVGAGTVIDNLVHIAHNVRIGRRCILTGQVGIAGSTVVGDGVQMGGQTGINDHLTIGSGARIAAKSGVIRDVAAGEDVGSYPAMPARQWHRQTLGLARLFQRKAAKPVTGAGASNGKAIDPS